MSTGKKILQALAGVLLAAAAALAVGTWVFPAQEDLIFTFSGLQVSVVGIGAGLSLLTLLAFGDAWSAMGGSRSLLNRIGFGLLPAVAVWKIFERHTPLGQGAPLQEGMPALPGLTAGGAWLPGRIETAAALVLFAAVVLWLVLRKSPLTQRGDLLGVSISLWAAVRLVTESLRANQLPLLGQERIVGWLAAGLMGLVLVCWILRGIRQHKNTGYALACVPVFVLAIAGIVLFQNGILKTAYPLADLILQFLCALLSLKSVLCMGRVTRE